MRYRCDSHGGLSPSSLLGLSAEVEPVARSFSADDSSVIVSALLTSALETSALHFASSPLVSIPSSEVVVCFAPGSSRTATRGLEFDLAAASGLAGQVAANDDVRRSIYMPSSFGLMDRIVHPVLARLEQLTVSSLSIESEDASGQVVARTYAPLRGGLKTLWTPGADLAVHREDLLFSLRSRLAAVRVLTALLEATLAVLKLFGTGGLGIVGAVRSVIRLFNTVRSSIAERASLARTRALLRGT